MHVLHTDDSLNVKSYRFANPLLLDAHKEVINS